MYFLLDLPRNYPFVSMFLTFLLGAGVGGFLTRCVARFPLQKSLFWPGSRCPQCAQPIRLLDQIPILSYFLLSGRCRTCKEKYGRRYFAIEVFTGLAFAGLFFLEVIWNVRNVGSFGGLGHDWELKLTAIWAYHALFLAFLIAATVTDAEFQEIPLAITIPGTILGIVGGTLAPWPWPLEFPGIDWNLLRYTGPGPYLIPAGLQRMPFWLPLPEWLAPGTWQLGLVTSLVGAAVGTLSIRFLRWIFTWGLRKEAMGLGDADLMMMIGAFLGWQALPLVMVGAVFAGLFYAIYLIIRNQGTLLPFGPFLAAGSVLTVTNGFGFLSPSQQTNPGGDVGNILQPYLFDWPVLLGVSILCLSMLVFLMVAMRMIRLLWRAA